MSVKGQPQWREEDRRIVAKLYALHLACHPDRIARAFGCTPRYVRALLAKYIEWQLPADDAALKRLESLKRHEINLLRPKGSPEV